MSTQRTVSTKPLAVFIQAKRYSAEQGEQLGRSYTIFRCNLALRGIRRWMLLQKLRRHTKGYCTQNAAMAKELGIPTLLGDSLQLRLLAAEKYIDALPSTAKAALVVGEDYSKALVRRFAERIRFPFIVAPLSVQAEIADDLLATIGAVVPVREKLSAAVDTVLLLPGASFVPPAACTLDFQNNCPHAVTFVPPAAILPFWQEKTPESLDALLTYFAIPHGDVAIYLSKYTK